MDQWAQFLRDYAENQASQPLSAGVVEKLREGCSERIEELSRQIVNALPGSDYTWAEGGERTSVCWQKPILI
jgi:hypothetical protein